MNKIFTEIFIKILLITLIPVIVANFFFYRTADEQINTNIFKMSLTNLNYECLILKHNIESVDSDIKKMINLMKLNISEFKKILKFTFFSNRNFSNIFLLDKNYKILDGIMEYGSVKLNHNLKIEKNKKFWIVDRNNEKRLAVIREYLPLYSSFNAFGNLQYIYAEISLKKIFCKYSGKIKNKFAYFILDNKGDLIFHSNYNYVLSKKNYKQILKNYKNNANILYFRANLYNPILDKYEKDIIALKKMSLEIPLYIGVEIPEKKALIYLSKLRKSIIIETLILFFLMIIISYLIAKRITKPVKELQELSIEITKGNYNVKVEDLPDNEIGILGKNLEYMALTIKNDIESIKREKNKLENLFNTMTNGAYVVDDNYNIIMINRHELNHLDLKLKEAIGQKCFKVFAKRDKPCVNCLIKKEDNVILRNININEYGFRKDCKREYVNMGFIKLSEDEYLIYINDITDIVKSFKVIEEEREKYKVTLQSIGDGVIVTDNKGNIVLMNEISSKLTGWNEADAKGKPLKDIFNIVDERDGKKLELPIDKVLRTKEIVLLSNHAILISKDGKKRHIADSAAPILTKDNILLGVVLVFRDVTEKKKIEQEIQKVEKLQTVAELAAGIAHDFNNILTGIYGNVSLAKYFIDNREKLAQLLDKVDLSIEKAKNLTSQLLTFAKGGTPVKTLYKITSLISECVDFILSGSNIKVYYKFQSDVWNVNIDINQMSQVFNNLTLNAKDAMPNGGALYVKAENVIITKKEASIIPVGKYVKVTFKDNGIGIDKEIISKIFDPFFTTKEKGSGLGLAISYSIIEKHDGFIFVESEKGEGTVFEIYLPAALREKEESVKEDDEIPQIENIEVLLMDDNENIIETAKELFEFLNCSIDVVKSGEEAIKKYKEKKFDLVILDLTVPGGMGGKETIKELLKIDPNLVAVVSSGYSDDEVLSNYEKYGFKATLRKPYTFKELLKMLKEVGLSKKK